MMLKELVDILNNDLKIEYSLVLRYMVMASQLDPDEEGEMIDDLLDLSLESVSHSRYVSDMIKRLGGHPTTEMTPFAYNPDTREVLSMSITIESRVKDSYIEVAARLREEGQVKMARRLMRLAGDEARHIEFIKEIMADVE